MTRIRALIVDDEPLARDGIGLRLERQADVEVVGSVGRPADAVAAIRRLAPDVLFLDVQMPGMTGFDVLAAAGADSVPVVIFVTAYDRFALRAFEARALDYLLKPVDDARFEEAMARARHQLAALRDGEAGRRLRALLADVGAAQATPAPPPAYAERLAVKERGRIGFVATADVDWIEAEGDYVRLHVGARSRLVRQSLAELERRLDPRHFLRVHRSTILNLRRVAELQPYFHGEWIAVTTAGARVKVSRTYGAALARALGVD